MKFFPHPRLALVSVLLLSLLVAPRALGLTTTFDSPRASPVAQDTTVHIVKWADTLTGIARRLGTTVATIVEANGVANRDLIWVGQRLIIPPSPTPVSECQVIHVVRRGETLTALGRRYGTTVAAIVAANGLANPDFIWVGQRLIIPVCDTPTPVPPGDTPTPTASPTAAGPTPTPAMPAHTPTPSPTPLCEVTYVVRRGDTLTSIARRFESTVAAIVAANRLANPSFIWVGQRLIIPVCDTPTPAPPGDTPTPTASPTAAGPTPTPAMPAHTPTPSPTPSCEVTYVVRRGDTLTSIARRFDSTVTAIVATNGLVSPNFIWVGQRLVIPVCGTPAPTPRPSPPQGKWIDVNLCTQTLIAYQGSTPVLQTLISGGTAQYPSPEGTFGIYLKLISQDMSGPGYYLPDVPYVMYFYGGYAIHGTYWHSNFGHPMSHGCINLPIPEAGWLYQWTPMGTPVVLHY